MAWSFPIGHLLGSQVRVHITFFLLLAWVAAAELSEGSAAAAIESVLFVLALFACVVAHEFGHAIMARRFGIRTPDITLLPIGGLARLERIPEDPRQEIEVALAGPAVNVVIWAALTLVLGIGPSMSPLETVSTMEQGFLARLAAINLLLAVFNMIPAFPMDGGRVLRAALATVMDRPRATHLAAQAGQAIALALGFLGLTFGNPFLLLIAVFVFLAASAEDSEVSLRARAHDVPTRSAMITSFEALDPDDTLEAAASALLRTTQSEFPVVDGEGRLTGFLTRTAIVGGANRNELSASVSSAMVGSIPSVQLDTPLDRALDGLRNSDVPAVAVTDRGGLFLGYVTREHLGEWMAISSGGK